MVAVSTLGIRLAAIAAVAGIGVITLRAETTERPGETALAAQAPLPDTPALATQDERAAPTLDLDAITLTSAEMPADLVLPRVDAALIRTAAPRTLPPPGTAGSAIATPQPTADCTPQATARPVAAAMVELTLRAPCLPDERVTVHHNGMIFTETTSASGAVTLTVPALARDAVFVLSFQNGDGAVAQATVEDLEDYDRAVLQWRGSTGLQIHAREFGARYGDRGHVWQDAPGDGAAAARGDSGFLTLLGDRSAADPLLAQVYTFPRTASDRAGAVALSVETEIGADNCGREVEAQTLELLADSQLRARTLHLAVPECDAAGSFLVLNNLLQDLTVAAR